MFGQTMHNRPSRFLDEISDQDLQDRPSSRWMAADAWTRDEPGMGGSAAASSLQRTQRPAVSRPAVGSRRSVGAASPAAGAPVPQFTKGQSVRHNAFGQGMILSVTPMGGDALLEIAFESVGTKRLMAKSAAKFMK